jgi:hypothetical protein
VLTAKAELQVSLQDDDNDENLPAYPSAPSLGQVHQMTPSDTTAFRMYSESLAKNGHNLDPSLIVNAICNHGGSIIFKGSSDWIIDPTLDRHLWGSIGFVEQSGGGCRQRRAIGKQSLRQRGQHRGRNDGRRRWHWHRRRPAHDSPTPPGPRHDAADRRPAVRPRARRDRDNKVASPVAPHPSSPSPPTNDAHPSLLSAATVGLVVALIVNIIYFSKYIKKEDILDCFRRINNLFTTISRARIHVSIEFD